MFRLLLLIFLAIPAIEIYLLIQVGGIVGAGWTIIFVIATAVIGVSLLRQQGLSTWTRLNKSLAEGQLPPSILVEGILLLLSGAFLITPGFFTDTVGFFFLIPAVRKMLAGLLFKRGIFQAGAMGSMGGMRGRFTSSSSQYSEINIDQTSSSKIIEGEYEDTSDKN
ncbi:MAG: FxsA family protein [Woeseiaceae bacterium]